MSINEDPTRRVPRLAAIVAMLLGAALVASYGAMIWLGATKGHLGGYIFVGLLPGLLGLFMLLGAWKLWRGDPAGGDLVKAMLWIPLVLFVGGVASALFIDSEYKWMMALGFAVVAAVLFGAHVLLDVAVKLLRRHPVPGGRARQ